MEALLHLLRELPDGCPEQHRAAGRLAVLVRPHLVRAASSVARRWKVPAEDLEQEGQVATFKAWRRFVPGREPGLCLYPAYVLRLARQAMERYAAGERSAVHVTDHALKRLRRAKKAARKEGVPVSTALRAQGLEEASILTLGEGSISTVSLDQLMAGEDGRPDAAANAETRLDLVDRTAARHQHVAEREAALTALYQLPRLQRVVVQSLAGYGRAPGAEPSERTVAQELRLPVDQVHRLHAQGLKRMREAMDAKGLGPELPARAAGKLRQRRAAAPRDVQPRPAGQGAQFGLALPAVESRRPSAWGA
ncbi:sigma factor [Corallococcus carmarthensis]|nr:sigma factor [Corallococcus carmarthensis]